MRQQSRNLPGAGRWAGTGPLPPPDPPALLAPRLKTIPLERAPFHRGYFATRAADISALAHKALAINALPLFPFFGFSTGVPAGTLLQSRSCVPAGTFRKERAPRWDCENERPTRSSVGTAARRWCRRSRTSSTWRIRFQPGAPGWGRSPSRRSPGPDFPG